MVLQEERELAFLRAVLGGPLVQDSAVRSLPLDAASRPPAPSTGSQNKPLFVQPSPICGFVFLATENGFI